MSGAANKEITRYKKRRLNNKESRWQRAQQNVDSWRNAAGYVLRLYNVSQYQTRLKGSGVATVQI